MSETHMDPPESADPPAAVIVTEAPAPAAIEAAGDAQSDVITAAGAADVARIEAEAAAQVKVMTAAAKLDAERVDQAQDVAADEGTSTAEVLDATDGSPEPSSSHWFTRKLFGR